MYPRRVQIRVACLLAEARVDLREDRRDALAEHREDADNNNSNQDKNEGVLDETLAFLTGEEVAKLSFHLLSNGFVCEIEDLE